MHRSIRDRLEDLLRAESPAVGQRGMPNEHLSACEECASELGIMKTQAAMVRSLRAVADVAPAPGFYGRVMQRIEERAKDSIWAVFIYSPFGKRLAYASLTLALALGSYVITREVRDGHLLSERMVAQEVHYDAPVIGSQAQQRDAVLENFATHHFAPDQGTLQ
jgi:hypothetical protein